MNTATSKLTTSPSSKALACSRAGPSTSLPHGDEAIVDERTHNELLILIERYLRNSACPEAADKLRQEIEVKRIIPHRIDYTGQTHPRRFEEYDRLIPGTGTELLDIAKRLFQVQNDLVPRWNLLGRSHLRFIASKKQSLLRTTGIVSARPLVVSAVSTRPGVEMIRNMNIVNRLAVRELGGRIRSHLTLPAQSMSKLRITQRVFGHLSPIFCVAFDRTGRYLFTGADDSLVKVWDVEKGTLRFTFRGHDRELTDISVNHENTMLATGSNDKTVRVSCLQTGKTLEVFTGHTHQVTLVKFLPYVHGNDRYLMSAANDGAVQFYKWNVETGAFVDTSHFSEREVPNQRIVSQCHSPGGSFVALGDTCRSIRVFRIDPTGVTKLIVLTTHNDRVDSMDWANSGLKFLSGSKDGLAKVWVLENGKFKSTDLIVDDANGTVSKKNAYRLTTLCWAKDDSVVITTGSDNLIRIWNWRNGQMIHVLKGHTAETFILCPHPIFHNFLLSAGYDGFVMVWDVIKGKVVKTVRDTNDSQFSTALFDMTVSPDGTRVAAVDCHGYLIILGINEHTATGSAPSEQFFDTDYRELHYDVNSFVLDVGTGLAPHLMSPPVLINGQGFPYEENYQFMVPGRDIEGHQMDTDLPCAWLTRTLIPPLSPNVQQDNYERRLAIKIEEDKQLFDTSGPQHIICNDVPRVAKAATTRRPKPSVPQGQLVSPPVLDFSSSSNDSSYSESRAGESFNSDVVESGSEGADGEQVQLLLDDEDEDRSSDSDFSVGESRQRPATSRRNNETSNQRTRRQREVDDSQRRRSSRGRPNGLIEMELNDGSSSSRASSSQADESVPRRQRRTVRGRSSYEASDGDRSPQMSNDSRSRPVRNRQQRCTTTVVESGPFPGYSSWMTQTLQRRFPYIPQIGDEVVYFREGYELYLKHVQEGNLYKVTKKMEPRPSSNYEEFCMVLKVSYELLFPSRVLRVILGVIDSKRRISKTFPIWVHDVDNVPDFLILRQLYDKSATLQHQTGKIQTILSNQFWTGQIMSRAQNVENPSSNWFSIQVRWDNGEEERVSPWDYDPNPSGNRHSESQVTPEDLAIYAEVKPLRGDWTDSTTGEVLESEIEARTRLTNFVRESIEILGEFPEVKAFTEAVDISTYHDYIEVIKYPIDLGTISERLRNKFYRNKSALLLDVWFISENAKQYNDKESVIVHQAKVLTEVLSRIINDSSCTLGVAKLYKEIINYDKADLTFWKQMPQVSKARINSQTSPDDGQHVEWIVNADAMLGELITKYNCLDNNGATSQEISQVYERLPSLREIQSQLRAGAYANPDALSAKVDDLLNDVRGALDDHKRSQSYIQCVSFDNDFKQQMKEILSSYNRHQIDETKTAYEQDEYDVGGHSLRSRRRPRQSHYNTRLNSEPDSLPTTSQAVRTNGRPSRAVAYRSNYNDILNGTEFDDVASSSRPTSTRRLREEEASHRNEIPSTSRRSTARRSGGRARSLVVESDSGSSKHSADKSWSDNENEEDEEIEEVEEAEASSRSSHSSSSGRRARRKRKAPNRYGSGTSESNSSRSSSKDRTSSKKKRRTAERLNISRQRPRRTVSKPSRYRESDSE